MKNIVRSGVMLLLLTALSLTVHAQDAGMNESKYWFYRHRLLTEFLASGESGCGQPSGLSIPCDKAYMNSGKTDEFGKPYDAQFKYGDGSSFLGYYIGVLATEFRLLSNNNAPQWQKDKVKEELYFAMKAFERLDKNAETLVPAISMSGPCESNANGFFLRDDVPASHNENAILDRTAARQLNDKFEYKMNREIQSDLGDHKDKPLDKLSGKNSAQLFISQDQAADMTVGFSLVVKLMGDESWQGYHFRQKAKENVNRIYSYMKTNDYFLPIPGKNGQCEQSLDLFGWSEDLHDFFMGFPLLDEVNFNPGISVNCLVNYGGLENRINAYALAQAGNTVFNEKMGAYDKFGVSFKPTTYDTYISGMLKPVWDKLNYPFGEGYYNANVKEENGRIAKSANDWNNAIISTMAAIGNSWEVGFKATKVFDQEMTVPAPCTHNERICFPKPWPLDGCLWEETVKVPDFPPNLSCSVSLGSAEVWCYSMPQEYVADAGIYAILSNQYNLGTGFTSALHKLITAAGILEPKLCVPFYNVTGDMSLPDITYNMTGYTLSKYGDKYNMQLFTLLHRVLHDGKGDYVYDVNKIESILNTAPCNGPHYKPHNDPNVSVAGDEGVYGWRNDNRFQKTIDASKRDAASASFPGLDYMLFYNLYQLAHGTSGTSDGYKNQMDVLAGNETFPKTVNSASVGSDVSKKRYAAYASLVSDNITVNAGSTGTTSNGNVSMKAGESIKLTNLKVKAGANFKASIERVTPCGGSGARVAASEAAADNTSTLTDEAYAAQIANALEEGAKILQTSVIAPQTESYQSVSAYLSQNAQGAQTGSPAHTAAITEVDILIYPNPIDDILTVSCGSGKIDQVTICDQLGNEVLRSSEGGSRSKVQLSTTDMPRGVYFVKVVAGDHLKVKKIIKTK